MYDRVLIAEEEEELVLPDRASEGSAELVPFERVPRRREEIPCVEIPVSDKFKSIAVKFIGAGPGNYVYRARGVLSILGGQSAGFDLELLYGVREGQRQVQIVKGIVVRSSVHQISQTVESSPSRADKGFVGIVFGGNEIAGRRAGAVSGLNGLGVSRDGNQLRDLASVQRQVHNLLLINHLTHCGAVRLHHRGGSLHLHCFADGANF